MNNSDANNKVIVNLLEDEIRLGSTINFFKLSPHANDKWTIKRFMKNDYKKVPFDQAFIVDFDSTEHKKAYNNLSKENQLEIELQQSVTFIVDIASKNECFDWRFSDGGSTLPMDMHNTCYKLATKIKNQGKTLVIKIDNVGHTTPEDIFDFRFMAICLNKHSGGEVNQVHYSQDPIIIARRTGH